MCSVFGILDIKSDAAALRPIALEMSKKTSSPWPRLVWDLLFRACYFSARALGDCWSK